ncbi:MAG TPA: glutamine amidotransferase [Vicinamibacterales bacterium]
MQFAIGLPWWALVLLAAAIVAVAWGAYAGAIVPLTRQRRGALVTLRVLTLLLLVACLLRPVRVMPPDQENHAVVPILVDASRSMRLADADGRPRIDAARAIVSSLQPQLGAHFKPEIWTFGSDLERPAGDRPIAADDERSDLSGALRAVQERYRDQLLAGVIVISDGGDTSAQEASTVVGDASVPVYAVGVGSPRAPTDFEVLDVSAGEAALTESSIDLTVAAVSRGAATPFDVRVLENGRPIDVRRVTPEAGGGPVRTVITVSPPRETATLYTVEIPSASSELVFENNRRSVLVEPPGRRRRVLVIEGAPGFEHSFIKRALMLDAGIEVDSVVRKGRDSQGDATYFVQSVSERAAQLASGFPSNRAALYQYDAVILANIEPDSLSRVQLEMIADFVGDRGGGLLVLGAKSFAQQGLMGTPIEDVLPVALSDRGSGVLRASARRGERYTVSITPDGESHPAMRIGATPDEIARRWSSVPALAGAATLGAPRPGARVLALIRADDGTRPLVAVQRFGQGRSMVFTGEASWRWRMRMPSTDRTYELFWRHAARWLSAASPNPVAIAPLAGLAPGESGALTVDVRNDEFAAMPDAEVQMRVTLPGGETRAVRAALADPRIGRYSGELVFEQSGIYRVAVEARQGTTLLGTSERWALVGGADAEMSDPRLNEDVLRRVARASGGRYVPPRDASEIPSLLESQAADPGAPRLLELWHQGWIFAAAIMLLAVEWFLRRHWGLR